MPKITSLEQLDRLKVEFVMQRNLEADRGVVRIAVGTGSCGIALGALDVLEAFKAAIKELGLSTVQLAETGCIGLCKHEPIVDVIVGAGRKVSYGAVTPELARRILKEHVVEGNVVEDFVIDTTPYPTM